MIRNDLQHIQLDSQKSRTSVARTRAPTAAFFTAEGIELKPTYSEKDIENLDHRFWCWLFSYLRGLYYYVCASPWTIRQYAGFSTAEESNAFIDVILLQDKRTIDRFRFADTPWV
jgi:methylmalonyl-CoA mutase